MQDIESDFGLTDFEIISFQLLDRLNARLNALTIFRRDHKWRKTVLCRPTHKNKGKRDLT